MKTRWFVTVAVASGFVLGAAQAQRIELIQGSAPPPTAGAAMYATYCARCHGEDGRGDGGVSPVLANKPADLTALTLTHSPEFPRRHVLATIRSGHAESPTTTPMPDWGTIFRLRVGDDPAVLEMRARALADHLESMQQR
ncbi:MAG TPA: cytochrome c [Candidatus Polarisedimenticolaceae bacterium]